MRRPSAMPLRPHFRRNLSKPIQRQPAEQDAQSPVASLLGLFENVKKVALVALTTLGVVAIAILFILGQKQTIVVGKFSISEEARKAGYDDLGLARQLASHIGEVVKTPASRKDARAIYSYDSEPTIDIEPDNWSLKALRQLFDRLSAKRRYVVTGELLSLGSGKASMTVRVEDSLPFSRQDSLAEIEKVMKDAAEYIVRTAEPYIFAAYLLSKGRDQEAIEQIRFCLSHAPPEDDAWAYNLWGVYYFEKGNFEDAAERFRRALEVDKRLGVAHFNLAQSLEAAGSLDAALSSYERAADLWPTAVALAGHGNALRRKHRYTDALAVLSRAVREFPEDKQTRIGIARTYLSMDQPDLALRHLEVARDMSDFDIELERTFAAVSDRLGMKAAAVAAYRRIVERDPKDEASILRLSTLEQRKKEITK